MTRQKRGVGFAMGKVVILLLMVVVIVLLFPLVGLIIDLVKGGGSSTTCTLSLIGGKGTANCPIDEVKIFSDKVEVNDKNFMERNSKTTDEMAKEALANLLKICLSRGGGHNSRAFSSEYALGSSKVCLECSHLILDDDVGNISGREFIQYLNGNRPNTINYEETWMEYLTKDETHREVYTTLGKKSGLSPSDETFTFTPEGDYTIFFLGIKKGSALDDLGRIGEGLRGNLYALLFESYDTYFTYITNSNNLGEICERKVN